MYYDVAETEYARIQPSQLRRHLQMMGWVLADQIEGRASIYHYPNNEEAEIVVPEDMRFRDYTLRIAAAVNQLATLRSRRPESVLRDIIYPQYDCFAYHVDGPRLRDHDIGLIPGCSLYDTAAGLFRAAAHDQVAPQPFHPRLARREATRYLDACRVAVPNQGSFIATIFCPADLEALEAHNPENENLFVDSAVSLRQNFARSVSVRTMRSIDKGIRAIQHDRIQDLISPDDPDEIVSSNFFEALGNLKFEDGLTEITIRVNWSPIAHVPAGIPTEVVLIPEYGAVFENVARALRPTKSPKTEVITGRVATLSGEPGESTLMQGEVIIDGTTSEDEPVRVRIDLSDEHYSVACDAHKLAQTVRVAGTLRRGERLHALEAYLYFQVILP